MVAHANVVVLVIAFLMVGVLVDRFVLTPGMSHSRTMALRITSGLFATIALVSILTGGSHKGFVVFLVAGVFVLAARLTHPTA